MQWAESLRSLRDSSGLTQQALADRVGIERSFVSLIERGRSNPTIGVVARWVEACGGELVVRGPGGDALGELEEDERRLVESYRGANAEQRGLLARIAEQVSLLDERDIAHLLATLDVAARGSPGSAPGGEVRPGRRSSA